MHIEAVETGEARAGHLLHRDHGETPVQAQAAIGFRGGGVEHAEGASALPDFAGHPVLFFPLLVERRALFRQEAADGVAELFVFVIEQIARNHGGIPGCGWRLLAPGNRDAHGATLGRRRPPSPPRSG
ncbi:hypothetical protein FQZ97_754280 [compost metagenome]